MTDIEFDEWLSSIGGLVNGWTNTSDSIQSHRFFCVDSGWYSLIKELIEKLIEIGWNKEIVQVKQKFGGLRFYTNELPEGGLDLICHYEKESLKTCEVCGKSASPRTNRGWIETLCDEHNEIKSK